MSLYDLTDKTFSNVFNGKKLSCCFHCHSDQSIDGASTVEDLVKRMAELEFSHVTITEHGTLGSAAAAHRVVRSKKLPLKVIHGVEGYIYWPGDEKPKRTYHITIFFKTREAFEAYCKLTPSLYSPPRVQCKAADWKPCMTWDDLLTLAQTKAIVVGTGCIGSWLNKPIADSGDIDEAKARMAMMIDAVGAENIYDEWIVDDLSYRHVRGEAPGTPDRLVQDECRPWFHSPDIGVETNRVRWEYISRPNGIRRVASQDAHYARPGDKVTQDNKRWSFGLIMPYLQHVKSTEEYAKLALATQKFAEKDVEELIDNTCEFVEHFDKYEFLTQKERGFLIPKHSENPREEIYKRIAEVGNVDMNDTVYRERIEYELSVLTCDPKYDGESYMLLTADIASMARENGILVGLRGSGGSCLTAYGIGLSVTDPIKYNLQFERFLTAGRIRSGSICDTDQDFSNKDKIMSLMKQKYGDAFIPISIDSLLKPKMAIKDVERHFLGAVRPETELMCVEMEGVPQGVDTDDWLLGYTNDEGDHVPGELETNPKLKAYAESNPEIWEAVLRMCGVMRQKSVHASGVVITPEPAQNYMPVIRVGKKGEDQLVTAYGPKDVEYIGIPKLDILGVAKMAVIEEAFRLIKERNKVDLKWGHLPHSDDVYKNVYWNGNTSAVFQGTEGITDLCQKCKPTSIEELSNLIALYRPGCLDAPSPLPQYKNMVDYYVGVKKGETKPSYIHPEMESVFGSTEGVPLFQEQALQSFRDWGKYTFETAEVVRRGISKKDKNIIDEHCGNLKKSLIERGWLPEQAGKMVEVIQASSRYSFNACVSGDEVIYRTSKSSLAKGVVTIRDMYLTMNDLEWAKQHNKMPLRSKYRGQGYGKSVSLFDNGRVLPNQIVDIRLQGTQPVLTIVCDNGKRCTVTHNHKIPTTRGVVRADELIMGDLLFFVGPHEKTNGKTYDYKVGMGTNLPKKGQHCANGRVKRGERGVSTLTSKVVEIVDTNETVDVYDVEMAAPAHNFALANGMIICNSHSTSYGIVSYHTAYLKHFYPLEYWCAELTVETIKGTNEDKLQQYGSELREMIEQPDIFKSDPLVWKINGNKLVAPLLSTKGVGDTFVEHLSAFVRADSLGDLELSEKGNKVKKEKVEKEEVFDEYD
jgi:DNA polymerase III alpha subunit